MEASSALRGLGVLAISRRLRRLMSAALARRHIRFRPSAPLILPRGLGLCAQSRRRGAGAFGKTKYSLDDSQL